LKLGNLREELPDVFNVVSENSSNSNPIKYEVDNANANMAVLHKY
jgi:hypothetical protein